MPELLIEILSEEIPARMQVKAGNDLDRLMCGGLSKAGLSVENARYWVGPRRLGFCADIPARSPDVSEERKGPRVGSPEQAISGFLRGAGLSDISQAETRSDKKGEHYVAVINKPGQDARDIVAAVLPDVMSNFPWPKSMKSGRSNFRWVRPVVSIVCVFDGDVVAVEAADITASNITQGHRLHGRGPFTISNYADYIKTLEGAGHVIVSHDMRADVILHKARAVCSVKGLELVEDPGLLAEVAGLAEWPVVILGDMDPSFLALPGEVIRLSMRTHQKYFAVRDPKTGALAPHFVVVANQAAPDGGKAIAAGNSRVLSARLSDAQFFQSEDAKKPLIDYYDKLDTVVFHKQLGSIRDKSERVAALAHFIAPIVGADADKTSQAAKLAKCDLVTHTVIEFTSLQGQIGRLMYEREGGDASIATAIEDHYKPQGPSDAVPTEPVAIAVALADKLDMLVGFWAIGEKPTGSKDPYALRRAALGVVRIILENGLRLDLVDIFNTANVLNKTANVEDLLGFILDRLKVYLRDQGLQHDIIDGVYAQGRAGEHFGDLVAIVNRIKALQEFLATPEGENLLAGYKRAANILKAESKKSGLPDAVPMSGTQDEETALFNALVAADTDVNTALTSEDYEGAMAALSGLRAPIDEFFDHVTVNDSDTEKRENRLALLMKIKDIAGRIADFDALEG